MNIEKRMPRRGATMVLMLFLLVVVFAFVAFAIDVGRIQLAQLKLQTASDLAARAGAEALARGVGDTSNLASYEQAIRNETDMMMQKNTLFGSTVDFDSTAQVSFGVATADNSTPSGSNGNGREKMIFSTGTNSGHLDLSTNSIRVTPDMNQFPMAFGKFLGRDNIALHTLATAKVQDRDIVVVLDRSTSMLDHDAGTISMSDYGTTLFQTEDGLYIDGDGFHPDSSPSSATSFNHTEFDNASGTLTLSKIQALKLAMVKFREVIDSTVGNEQLGLTTYSNFADDPSDAATPVGTVDITNLSQPVFDQIVGTGITTRDATERYASDLEDRTTNYDNFDYNFLAMRWYGGTNITDGIEKAVSILTTSANRRVHATPIILVLTDGSHNTTLDHNAASPFIAAQNAIAANPTMLIYTITFGDSADQTAMIDVANAGNGQHLHASDVTQLVDIFSELASTAGVTVIE